AGGELPPRHAQPAGGDGGDRGTPSLRGDARGEEARRGDGDLGHPGQLLQEGSARGVPRSPEAARLRRAPALLLLLACCVAPIACGTAPPAQRRSTDLLNARLSPAYAQWLVGPVAHLATEAEVQQFLALADDAA